MQLPAPARECSDAELQEVYDYYEARRQESVAREKRRVAFLQHTEQCEDYYSRHTSECAPDDDDGPAQDWRSMNALVLAFCLCWVAMSAIALALVML